MKNSLVYIGLLASCFISGAVFAQTPNTFYENRHVERMLEPEAERLNIDSNARARLAPAKSGAVKKSKAPVLKPSLSGEDANPVLALSAVINSDDAMHFAMNLRTLTKTAIEIDVPLYQLEATGNYISFARSREARKQAGAALTLAPILGAVPQPGQKLTKKYQVKHSPSWILHTERGDVVLDGLKDPGIYIDAEGNFIEQGNASGVSTDFTNDSEEESK